MRRVPSVLALAFALAVLVALSACSGKQTPAPPAARPAAAPAGPRAFTVDELLKLKRVSDPQLSPDGTRIALVVTEVDQQANSRASHIWMVKTTGGAPGPLAPRSAAT